jgi:rRNA biogenesis protein RRP5
LAEIAYHPQEMFDDYVKDWKSRFSVGQVVEGKILSTNAAKKQIEMTLRKTASSKKAGKEKEPSITFEGLSVGETVKGLIKRIEAYGVFIRIESSSVSGLCHKTKVLDDGDKSKWSEGLSVGDHVRAKIIELDHEKHKIAFSMKPSDLPEESEVEEEEEENEVMQKLNHLINLQDAASDEEDDDDEDDSDDDLRIMMEEEDGSDEDDDEEDEDEAEADVTQIMEVDTTANQPEASTSAGPAPLKLSAFKWDGTVDAPEKDEDNESASDDDEEDDKPSKSKGKDILIDDKTGDLASQAPTSPTDFDRVLLASPNSSFLWIQYMSYYLQLGDVEQARQISQRALKTINYREEEERLNIWIAMLNLESMFGTDDSFDKLFAQAIQTNDAKQVFLRTTDALESAEKFQKAEEIYQRFVKKYNMSSKAWTLYGQFLLKHGKADGARDLLQRSLKSLPKRKHVKTISQFGLMEFKIGEPERGRTIFEGIVSSYPKRLDLWWIYIDQEIRLRNVIGARALFDRVLLTKLSSSESFSFTVRT